MLPALAIDRHANVVVPRLDPPPRIELLAVHRVEAARRRAVTVTLDALADASLR